MKNKSIFKKKVWVILSIVLAIGIISLQSCEKSTDDITPDEVNLELQSEKSPLESGNVAGTPYTRGGNAPFEWMGMKHNEMMDMVKSIPSFPNMTRQEVYDLMKQDFENEGLPISFSFEESDNLLDLTFSFSNLEDLANYYHQQGQFSDHQRNAMIVLNQIIFEHTNQKELERDLLNFETNLVSSFNLSDAERNALTAAAVIARYSSAYWDAAISDPNDPWGFDNGQRIPRWLKKLFRIAADVAGLAIGTEIAGPAGGIYLAGEASSLFD